MKYYFNLNITSQEYLPYYQGKIQSIIVRSEQGVKVEFPAMHLRKYLTGNGIKGHFCLQTQNNKFLSLDKLS
ncbi:DUF2835 domain-containing protein [Cognaticolwellia beringensis]|uniref:DUF2835 domain-containing protein n=1 Tax=Cognaticolwellia beringensis TaxID=1967665 RepID=A0A222GD31_9GAMM|nr:DUF2835 domain-containing protein [Cognaticolwellia beringensis]ASP49573.1 DUF2835 domain-containing protein [Cognaticolwellia beringensis]|tara:strand:+ start:2280 stop:2495 length:216 start_codon:yes stop_codon:yes gene_type:complete